jgi:peptidoglycan/LPS O-acetylase OafA/YrhL
MRVERSIPAGQKIPSLDGLRTVSVALVVLGHLGGTAHYPRNAVTHFLGSFAHLGVQTFFVISGFLITTLLLREQDRTGRINLPHFYLRRTVRIFPAAFTYITVIALVANPGFLAYAYTYTMCYASQHRPWLLGHLWSLSVEEQFYLLWPIALALGFAWRRRIGLAVLLLAPIARLLFWTAGMHEIDEYFPAVADCLMMGCLLAMYQPQMRQRARWLQGPWVFGILALLMFGSQFLLWRVRLEIFLGGLIPLSIAAFLFAAVERADWFLNNRFMNFFGVLSYSLYLWQQPFLNRNRADWWTTFPLNLLLALGLALMSYFWVEKPFLGLVRHRAATPSRSFGKDAIAEPTGD